VLALSRDDVAACLDESELIDRLADAFVACSNGTTSVPPRVAAFSGAGLLGAMPAYASGILETKLVSVFPGNEGTATPTHQALIAIFDPDDGRPLALLDGTHITAVRTAASAALAVRTLARADCDVLTIIGAGVQGDAHARLVPQVRAFAEVRVASRTYEHAAALAARHAGRAVASFRDAVDGAAVVCLCTDAPAPVVAAEWIAPGATITSVGASGGTGADGELDRALLGRARLFVESRVAFEAPPAGAAELHGVDASVRDAASELGEVLAGRRDGRRDEREILVYKSMGHAIEDAAAAAIVYARARAEGRGVEVAIS